MFPGKARAYITPYRLTQIFIYHITPRCTRKKLQEAFNCVTVELFCQMW